MEAEAPKARAVGIYGKSGDEGLDDFIATLESDVERMELCSALLLWFYWDRKDLAGALKYGSLAVRYHRQHSGEGAPSAADLTVKGVHYNIASFTWLGWDEPGIAIGDEELEIGLKSARTNLELARDLGRGALAEARALWMLAGHLLAQGDHSGAVSMFGDAATMFEKAGKQDEELMAQGFLELARYLGGAAEAGAGLQAALERLSGVEGGNAFASQIETALQYFKRAGKAANP